MVKDTGLETLCARANSKEEFLDKTNMLFQQEFNSEIRNQRALILKKFHPLEGAKKIKETIFKR